MDYSFCPNINCGCVVLPGMTECAVCDTKLSPTEQPSASAAVPEPAAPPAPKPPAPKPAATPAPKPASSIKKTPAKTVAKPKVINRVDAH
eukprot:6058164-Prymnesium_polylepis.1